MGATWQLFRYLLLLVPLPAGIVLLKWFWWVSQVDRKVLLMGTWQSVSVEILDCIQTVLEVIMVCPEIMASVLWIAEGELFQIHHIHLGGNIMLPMMSHNSDILSLHWSLVASIVLGWMGQGSRTGNRLETVAVKAAHHTLVVNETDMWVAWMLYVCKVYFGHYNVTLPKCHQGLVAGQTDHQLESEWLSPGEISLLTPYANQIVVNKYEMNWWYRIQQSIVANIVGSSYLWRNEALLYKAICLELWWSTVSLSHKIRLRNRDYSHAHPICLWYMLQLVYKAVE